MAVLWFGSDPGSSSDSGDSDQDRGDGGGGDGGGGGGGSGCGPSVLKARINGFLLGATKTCAYLFATEAMRDFVGDNKETSENVAQMLASTKMNTALAYAASRPNYLRSEGLMYPFKSSIFRKLFSASETAAESAWLINADQSIWQALGTEYDAALNGECSFSGR